MFACVGQRLEDRMPAKPLDFPLKVARAFVRDMEAFFDTLLESRHNGKNGLAKGGSLRPSLVFAPQFGGVRARFPLLPISTHLPV